MAISVGKLHGSPRPEDNDDALGALGTEEREAFNDFYREFVPRVAGYVRRHIHDYELIDEIVQETLLRAYRHGLHFEEGDEHWRWLATVARNLCIDQRALHRNWRESSVEEPETLDLTVYESDPEARVVAAERQEIVARALERLTERERRLLVQKHIEGRRVREMATHEGVHVEALKSALRRARKAFAESYAAVTDRTGVASVFGPVMAAVGLRLRGWRVRLTQTAERVSAVSANIVPTGDALHTAVAGAVVVGLALGPGLGGLVPDGGGSGDGESSPSSEVAWGDDDDAGEPALAASSRASTSARGGPSGGSGFWSSGDGIHGGSGGDNSAPGDGGDSGGGDGGFTPGSPGGSGVDVPTDGPSPAEPEPEPVDLGGEDDVEEPEDTRITDFAYAPASSQGSSSAPEDESDDQDGSASNDGTDTEATSGGEEDSGAEDDEASESEESDRAETSGSDDESESDDDSDAEGTSGDGDAGTQEETGESRGEETSDTDDGWERDDTNDAEPSDDTEASDTENEAGDGDETEGSDNGDQEGEIGGDGEVPEIFAIGEPLPEKAGDCKVQCTVLWHSTDGGATWERLPAKGLEASGIVLAPEYPDDPRLFAYGWLGLMVSSDGGHTFWPAGMTGREGFFGWREATAVPGIGTSGAIAVASRQGRVALHHLDGAVWQPLPVDPAAFEVRGVAESPANSGESGVFVSVVSLSPRNRTFVYFCDGVTCERRYESGMAKYELATIRGPAGSALWAWAWWGTLRSDDGGRSFTRVDAEGGLGSVVDIAGDGTRVFALASGSVFALDDDGGAWSRVGTLPRADRLAVIPGGPLVASHYDRPSEGGFRCSVDDGQTWAPRCPAADPASG